MVSPTGENMGLCHMPDCPSEDACKHAEYAACLASLCSCGYACSRVDLQPMSHCMPIALQPATPPCNGFGLIEASLCLHHAKSCTPQHFCKSGIMPKLASCQIMHTTICKSGIMPSLESCQIMHTMTCLQIWHHANLAPCQTWHHAKSCTPQHICMSGITSKARKA